MAMPVLTASLFLPIVFNVLRRRLVGMGQRWWWEDFFMPPADDQLALSAMPDFLPWAADDLATPGQGLTRLRPAVCACGGCGSDHNGDGCARDAGWIEADLIKEDLRLSLYSPLKNVSEAFPPTCREVITEILLADAQNAPDGHRAYELLFESSCESFHTCGLPTSLSSESSPLARVSMYACNKDKSPSPPPLSRGLLCPGKQTPDGCQQTFLQQLGGLGDIRDQEVPTKSPALDDFEVWRADGVASLRQQCTTSYCIIQETVPRKKGFNRSRGQSRAVKHRKVEEPLPLSQMKAMTTELLSPSPIAPSVQLAGPVMQFEQMRSTTAALMGCDMGFDSARSSTAPPTETCQVLSDKVQAEGNEPNPLQGAHLKQAVPPDQFSSTGSRQEQFFTADKCDCCRYTTPTEGTPLTYCALSTLLHSYTREALRVQEQHPNGDVFYPTYVDHGLLHPTCAFREVIGPHVQLAPTDNIHTSSGCALSPSALKCCLLRQAEAELGVCPKEQGCYTVAGNGTFVTMEEICDVDQFVGSLKMPCSSHVSQDTMRVPIPAEGAAKRRQTKCAGRICVKASQGDDVGNSLQDQLEKQMERESETSPATNLGPLFTDQIVRLQENIKGNDVQEKEQLEAGELLEVKIGPVTHSETLICKNVIGLDATPVERVTTSEEKECLDCGSKLVLSFQTSPTSKFLKVQTGPVTNSEMLFGDNIATSDTNSTEQDRLVSGYELTIPFQNHPPSRILETETGPVLNSDPMFSDNAVSSDATPVEGIQKSEEQDSLISGCELATPFQTPPSPTILENAVQQSEHMATEPVEKNTTLPSLQESPSTMLLEELSEEIEQTTVEPLEKNNLPRSRLVEETSAQPQQFNAVETQRKNKAKPQLHSLLPRIRKNTRCLGKFAMRYLEHIERQLVCSPLPHKLPNDNPDSPEPNASACDQRNDSGIASDSLACKDPERHQLQEEEPDWEGDRSEYKDVGVEADGAEKPAHVSWTDVQTLADSPACEKHRQDVATPLSESSTSSLLEVFSTNMSVTEAFDQLEVVVENLLGLLGTADECSVSDHPSSETMSSDDNVARSSNDVRNESVFFVGVNMASSVDSGHDHSGNDVLGESVSFSEESEASSVGSLHNRVETSGSYLLGENVCSIDENMASSVCGVHDNTDYSGRKMQVACRKEENTASSVYLSETASLNSNGRWSTMSLDK